jgi:hypothetical protein
LIHHPKEAKAFRDALLRHDNNNFSDYQPVTLPKLIEAEDRDYLRVALDPARVTSSGYGDLLEKALNQISANAASLEA